MMAKHLLALIIVLPFILTGCFSGEEQLSVSVETMEGTWTPDVMMDENDRESAFPNCEQILEWVFTSKEVNDSTYLLVYENPDSCELLGHGNESWDVQWRPGNGTIWVERLLAGGKEYSGNFTVEVLTESFMIIELSKNRRIKLKKQ